MRQLIDLVNLGRAEKRSLSKTLVTEVEAQDRDITTLREVRDEHVGIAWQALLGRGCLIA